MRTDSCERQALRLAVKHSSIAPLVQWISDSTMQVYIRVSWRYIGDRRATSLEIGNVEVRRGKRGKGRFTQFLKALERENPREVLYVESVLEDRFRQFFRRRTDYVEVPTDLSSSFFRWQVGTEVHVHAAAL